jgi:hypothetical protein
MWGEGTAISSLMFRVLTEGSITNFHEVIINNVSRIHDRAPALL